MVRVEDTAAAAGALEAKQAWRHLNSALVHSPWGAFELTRDLRLVRIPAPIPSLRIVAVAEMPPSGVAAVIAASRR